MRKKRTQRRASKPTKNSTQNAPKSNKFDAKRYWSELDERVRHLEDYVARLRADDMDEAPQFQAPKIRMKRGPKSRPDWELAESRDELIAFFESNWPELEPLCLPAPNMKALKQAFEAFAHSGKQRTPWGATAPNVSPGIVGNHISAARRLLAPDAMSQIKEFLTKQQTRFAGNPRQLANAMAGCPHMSFWTSLKRCQRIPFRFGIQDRAMKSYIRHKHPRLYERLSENPSLPELAAFRRKYRTKDQIVKLLSAEELNRLWTVATHVSNRASN